MDIRGRIAVVTGGANGIGAALCRKLAAAGAAGVVVADLELDAAQRVANEIGGIAIRTDVTEEAEIKDLVEQTIAKYGRIDIFCSNAGILGPHGAPLAIEPAAFQRVWEVNVLAHLYAARAVLPAMLDRGEGYLLQTVSAAGLLNQIKGAAYGVSKHAAIGLAESLSIEYGDRGIRVSCLCPQGVRTRMLDGAGENHFLQATAISADDVADAAIQGIANERFLILPHPVVAEYFSRKASDYDRWLRGMRRLKKNST